MTDRDDLRRSYDTVADAYAKALSRELDHKPLDRAMLAAFAEIARGKGKVLDVGCGPGHVAAHLHALGLDVEGVDLSPAMIRVAQSLFPGPAFRTADFHELPYAAEELAAVTAFYAIVHLELDELGSVFRELHRCLRPGGVLLLSFHVGEEPRVVSELFGEPVSMTFRFLPVAGVRASLEASGFSIEAVLERQGDAKVEYPSLRAYVLARKSQV